MTKTTKELAKTKKAILQGIIRNVTFSFHPQYWDTIFDAALQELKEFDIVKSLKTNSKAVEKYMNPSYMYSFSHGKHIYKNA